MSEPALNCISCNRIRCICDELLREKQQRWYGANVKTKPDIEGFVAITKPDGSAVFNETVRPPELGDLYYVSEMSQGSAHDGIAVVLTFVKRAEKKGE